MAGVLLELDGRDRLGVEALFDALAAASALRLPATVHGLAGAPADVLAGRRGGDAPAARPAAGEELLARVLGGWARLAGTTGAPLPVPRRPSLHALGPALTGSTSLAHLCLPAAAGRRAAGPAASRRGQADGLWAALADGRLQSVASDHRPPPLRRQPDAPPHVGVAAAALRLPLLHTDGVAAGRIDLPRLAALTAEAPARRLGLWPRKGSLEPGADADVVLLDPAARWTVVSARVEGRGRAPAWDGRDLDRARALRAGPRRLARARRQRPLPPRPRPARRRRAGDRVACRAPRRADPDEIRAVSLFATLAQAELERLSRAAADLTLLPGEYAAHESGERALFAVIEGRIEAVKTVDGVTRIVGQREPGDIFGEVPIVLGTVFPAGFRAGDRSRVMRVGASEYHSVAAAHPDLAKELGRLAAHRMGGARGLQSIAAEPPPPRALVVGQPAGPGLRRTCGASSTATRSPSAG